MNGLMSMRSIPYGDIVNGDKVWIEGVCFEASNVRTVDLYGKIVVRFTGTIVPGASEYSDSLINTGYNGGSYGGTPDLKACIECRN